MKLLNENVIAEDFKSQAQQWVKDFCAVYESKHITPYTHAMAIHVHEFIGLHGNVSNFIEQGLEKLNDFTTKHYT